MSKSSNNFKMSTSPYRRIVVKFGTSLLTGGSDYLNLDIMSNLADWDAVERLLPQRVIEKIHLTIGPLADPCWEWTGSRDVDGYGRLCANGQNRKASRVVYEILHGPITESLELDHICRNRSCVNPLHLELVPHQVNVARGNAGQYLRQRTHCPEGHPYDAVNTYVYGKGKRGCLKCRRERSREWRRRQHFAQ